MGHLDNYADSEIAFHTGDVLNANNATLLRYLSGLANTRNTNEGTQHRDVIRGLTINNILLQRHVENLQSHITLLDHKNSTTQKLVVVLTIAALAGSVSQIWYAYKADKRAEKEAESTALKPQPPTPILATPSLSSSQAAIQNAAPGSAAKK